MLFSTTRLLAVLSLLAAGLLGVPAAPAQAATFSGTLAQAVAQIPTASESNSGYDRDLFPHWVDANGDCQNTRAEVLISERETDTPLTYTSASKCTVKSGRWYSYYDGVSWTAASDVDIDHMVPLAEAWGSGARSWTTARRQAYANDLGDHRTLVGVTDNVNQSKSDQDPAQWLPTRSRCRYVAEWVAVKVRWGLSADASEKSVLNSYAGSCSNTVTVTIY
ncbi:HNH endonuclease family protein [Nocardioides sambongensis]|uniref:HNH endonuclease family protein n=1 Tax=Nocardioides sambongensis TaxID=2589074 RepID=UPI001125FD3B|nr:HNH endonuclease family protein [Nocardioides sambongensis]